MMMMMMMMKHHRRRHRRSRRRHLFRHNKVVHADTKDRERGKMREEEQKQLSMNEEHSSSQSFKIISAFSLFLCGGILKVQ